MKDFIIKELLKVRNVDVNKRIIIKELDYSENFFSPVKTAYRVFYSDILGNRRKSTYFGENLGFQG